MQEKDALWEKAVLRAEAAGGDEYWIISRKFVEIVITIIAFIGFMSALVIAGLGLFSYEHSTLVYLLSAGATLLGTAVFLCSLVLGLLHINKMERIAKALEKDKGGKQSGKDK